MIKVLLVDDEDIEREGMAAAVPWEALGMTLTDTAWNGIEGLEKIRMHVPDIVITDIKMPVMDGIQLIRSAKELYPDILFVVLSGYGEYEYTSRAMELGIRHYILKPCDEEKIVEVLTEVRKEFDQLAERRKKEREYRSTFFRMLPRVKEQLLGILVQEKEMSASDQILLERFMKNVPNAFVLLGIRFPDRPDQLDQFVLTNILTELLGTENIYMSTAAKEEMLYLLPANTGDSLKPLLIKVHREYGKYRPARLRSAVSQAGKIEEMSLLYRQLEELFFLGDPSGQMEFLSYDLLGEAENSAASAFDYAKIRSAKSYGDVLFELFSSYARLKAAGFSGSQIEQAFALFLRVFCGSCALPAEGGKQKDQGTGGLTENRPEHLPANGPEILSEADWAVLERSAEACASFLSVSLPDTKDGERLKRILESIYRNIQNPDLSLQYLAREVLFMNEDYFGRFFYRCMHEKYSSFLIHVRIELAKRLMAFRPDIRISELAEQIGFPADGQYFSKVFKKAAGMSPSEYRQSFCRNFTGSPPGNSIQL